MEIKVLWTETALNNLEDIFEYFKYKASIRVAKRLVKGLVKSTLEIQNSPQIGKIEELLTERQFEYRFLVVGNYKIIYWIDNNYVKIATVFDCRQNPEKLNKL
jgi:plasmid stabilization system protein ParE